MNNYRYKNPPLWHSFCSEVLCTTKYLALAINTYSNTDIKTSYSSAEKPDCVRKQVNFNYTFKNSTYFLRNAENAFTNFCWSTSLRVTEGICKTNN
jgi:hypothetical protein